MSVGNIGVRQRTISSGAFLREATRTLIQIVALQVATRDLPAQRLGWLVGDPDLGQEAAGI